jgi:serine/threonine-protein kinase RsbW
MLSCACVQTLRAVRPIIQEKMAATFRRRYQPNAQWLCTARRDIAQFATHCGFDPEQVSEIVLATGEALSNVIEHAASPRNFHLRCEFDGDRLVVTVQDHGTGFSPPNGTPGRDSLQPRGLGIFLMKRLMDSVEFSMRPSGGTTLTLEKRKESAMLGDG